MRSRAPADNEGRPGRTGVPTVRPRRFWFDPRFAIGLGLVVVAVAGTAFVVSAADVTSPVLGARSALSVGQVVTADDLVPIDVRVPGADDLYLAPGQVPDAGLVVTRPVAAGELVPASALGTLEGIDVTTVVVPLDAALGESVRAGSGVDLWAAAQLEGGSYGPPSVIVPGAAVVRIVAASGIVVDEDSGSVELLVPRSRVARVLGAIANGDALSIVPVSLPVAPPDEG